MKIVIFPMNGADTIMTPGSFRVAEWRKANRDRYNYRQKIMMRAKRKRDREKRERESEKKEPPCP